jgi:hypothetical protein
MVFHQASLVAAGLSLMSCGAGDQRTYKTRNYSIAVANESASPVKLRFDAGHSDRCEKGRVKFMIPAMTSRVLDISFLGCTDGGAEQIEGVAFEFPSRDRPVALNLDFVAGPIANGSKIICGKASCALLDLE